jgi:hypothetical protein
MKMESKRILKNFKPFIRFRNGFVGTGFFKKYRGLFEKVLELHANHDSVLLGM